MYQPAHFRVADEAQCLALIRARPLGLLITHGPSGLMANPVPFLFVEGAPRRLVAHLAKANPQLAEIGEGADVLVVFQGDDAYVSPNWYETKRETHKVVPTWNYLVVQARGRARLRPEPEWLRAQIDALTTQQEQGRSNPWAVSDAPADFIAGQMKGIVGVEIELVEIVGKAKMSQNRNDADRAGVREGLAQESDARARAVAKLIP